MSDFECYIGIDPDLKKSGVAIMRNGEYSQLLVLSMPELVRLINEVAKDPDERSKTCFVLEDVNANKPTFKRGKGAVEQVILNRISQNVGMVKASASLIEEFLVDAGCNHVLKRPMKGFAKKAKDDAKYFARLTGWKGRTNSDKRDAAMLIYCHRKVQFLG